ncbi:MAG: LysR family transcriptional regulator [Akkermansiaceae bacterium]
MRLSQKKLIIVYKEVMDDSVDTKKLRMFVETFKEGSMRRASKSLFVTPSALSHGIRALEESLQTQLFTRNGPVLTPTQAGHQFFNEAQDILGRLDDAVSRFSTGEKNDHLQLHIGTTNTGCRHLFPGIVREFRESFPNVSLKLEIGDTDHLLKEMNERKLDIVIAPVQRDYLDFVQVELGYDELVHIVHPSHAWARSGKVDLASLGDEKLIVPSVQSHTYDLIDSFYRDLRVPLDPFIELNNEEAIKQLVSLNIGTGIVPRWIIREEVARGSLYAFALGDQPLRRRWTVLHRETGKLSFPEFLFIGMTKAVARNLLG